METWQAHKNRGEGILVEIQFWKELTEKQQQLPSLQAFHGEAGS